MYSTSVCYLEIKNACSALTSMAAQLVGIQREQLQVIGQEGLSLCMQDEQEHGRLYDGLS